MKKTIFILIIFLLIFTLNTNASVTSKGEKYITPQWVVAIHGVRIGASYGLFIKDNIEVGASLLFYNWSQDAEYFYHKNNMFKISFDTLYHLDILKMKKLDTFVGVSAGVGVDFHSVYINYGLTFLEKNTKLPFFISPFAGARYFIKDNLAIFAKGFISYYTGFTNLAISGAVGVSLRK